MGPERARRPRLSDFRESGQIAQDADLVAVLYPDKSPGVFVPDIAKQRKGPIGRVCLAAQLDRARFHNHVGPVEIAAPRSRFGY